MKEQNRTKHIREEVIRIEDNQCITVCLVSIEITILGRIQDRGEYIFVCVKFCFISGEDIIPFP